MIRFTALFLLALVCFAMAAPDADARLFGRRCGGRLLRATPRCDCAAPSHGCEGRRHFVRAVLDSEPVQFVMAPLRILNEVRPRLCTRDGCN